MRPPTSSPPILALAFLLLAACGGAGLGGEEHCYWDGYGNYVCYGSYYKGEPAATIGPVVVWPGSFNGCVVLDANDDALRFEAEGSRVLLAGATRFVDLTLGPDDALLWRGEPIGRVAPSTSEDGLPVVALTTLQDTLFDLVLEDGLVRLESTSIAVPVAYPATVEPSEDGATGPACVEVIHGLGLQEDASSPWQDLGAVSRTVDVVDLAARR